MTPSLSLTSFDNVLISANSQSGQSKSPQNLNFYRGKNKITRERERESTNPPF